MNDIFFGRFIELSLRLFTSSAETMNVVITGFSEQDQVYYGEFGKNQNFYLRLIKFFKMDLFYIAN